MKPKPGDVFLVDGKASVQFSENRALILRVTQVCNRPTYHGWVWLTGYVLDRTGQATDRREIFVQLSGLRVVPAPTSTGPRKRATTRPTVKAPSRK